MKSGSASPPPNAALRWRSRPPGPPPRPPPPGSDMRALAPRALCWRESSPHTLRITSTCDG
eukprot:356934-Chlamydomonas_euryale.AAC.2